jgi:hypothetical protein
MFVLYVSSIVVIYNFSDWNFTNLNVSPIIISKVYKLIPENFSFIIQNCWLHLWSCFRRTNKHHVLIKRLVSIASTKLKPFTCLLLCQQLCSVPLNIAYQFHDAYGVCPGILPDCDGCREREGVPCNYAKLFVFKLCRLSTAFWVQVEWRSFVFVF